MSLDTKSIESFENKRTESDDDDMPVLSVEAMRALQEFYAESEANAHKIEEDWVKMIKNKDALSFYFRYHF